MVPWHCGERASSHLSKSIVLYARILALTPKEIFLVLKQVIVFQSSMTLNLELVLQKF